METKQSINEVSEDESNKGELIIPDHAICESTSMMDKTERFIDRAEGVMQRYPWVVFTMAAGLGYIASRRLT